MLLFSWEWFEQRFELGSKVQKLEERVGRRQYRSNVLVRVDWRGLGQQRLSVAPGLCVASAT